MFKLYFKHFFRSIIYNKISYDSGELETDDSNMGVLLNLYFCFVFTLECQNIPNPLDIIPERQIDALSTVNFPLLIEKLKVTKSAVPCRQSSSQNT